MLREAREWERDRWGLWKSKVSRLIEAFEGGMVGILDRRVEIIDEIEDSSAEEEVIHKGVEENKVLEKVKGGRGRGEMRMQQAALKRQCNKREESNTKRVNKKKEETKAKRKYKKKEQSKTLIHEDDEILQSDLEDIVREHQEEQSMTSNTNEVLRGMIENYVMNNQFTEPSNCSHIATYFNSRKKNRV